MFTDFVLSLCGKTMDNVVALIGDRCEKTRTFLESVVVTSLVNYSHKFNLSAKDFLNDSKDEIAKVRLLMDKIRTTIAANYES